MQKRLVYGNDGLLLNWYLPLKNLLIYLLTKWNEIIVKKYWDFLNHKKSS